MLPHVMLILHKRPSFLPDITWHPLAAILRSTNGPWTSLPSWFWPLPSSFFLASVQSSPRACASDPSSHLSVLGTALKNPSSRACWAVLTFFCNFWAALRTRSSLKPFSWTKELNEAFNVRGFPFEVTFRVLGWSDVWLQGTTLWRLGRANPQVLSIAFSDRSPWDSTTFSKRSHGRGWASEQCLGRLLGTGSR